MCSSITDMTSHVLQSTSLSNMKDKVLSSFKTPGSELRIVITTTAFGMGVGCPDIEVFHCCHEIYDADDNASEK